MFFESSYLYILVNLYTPHEAIVEYIAYCHNINDMKVILLLRVLLKKSLEKI